MPSDVTLEWLHLLLQQVMGWEHRHLHMFGTAPTAPGHHPRALQKVDEGAERETTLDRVLRRQGDRLTYVYDFGDDWVHDIVLEEVIPLREDGRDPVVEGGERACPPEDVGGIPGYYGLLEALADPSHPDHEHLTEWVGGSFDPDAFDLDAANRALHGG